MLPSRPLPTGHPTAYPLLSGTPVCSGRSPLLKGHPRLILWLSTLRSGGLFVRDALFTIECICHSLRFGVASRAHLCQRATHLG